MAYSVNEVRLLGNLGADPEIKALAGDTRLAKLSVATSVSWKNARGEWEEKTSWHRVAVWQNAKGPRLVDLAERLRKGDKVYVAGSMTYDKYTDRDGVTRTTAEVKADRLIPLVDTRNRAPADAGESAPATTRTYDQVPEALDAEDDDLPF
jgi:single-strand DNA-binding protein